jgi:hypothetical protein
MAALERVSVKDNKREKHLEHTEPTEHTEVGADEKFH